MGAGYAGAVTARALAEKGRRVLVLERRDHVAGNAYDRPDQAGILIHQYGPHIFHTNDKRVFDWLSRFTQWRDYRHRVIANIPDDRGGRMTYPVPFNLTSLETAFGMEEGKRLGDKLIAAYRQELLRRAQVQAQVTRRENGTYTVELRLSDDVDDLMQLRLMVATEEMARDLAGRFERDPEQIYSQLVAALYGG